MICEHFTFLKTVVSFNTTNSWNFNHIWVITQLQLDEKTHQYDNIHSSLHQQVQSVFVILPCADSSTTQQLFARVFGGQWVVPVLLQISSGDDGHQLVIIIYNGKLA